MTCRIYANTCNISDSSGFSTLNNLYYLTIGLTKHNVCVSNSPHFWTPIFEKKKNWNCTFLGEHKCIFKVWMLLSGMICILAGEPLRCTKGPWLLGHSWLDIFLKCFLDLLLTWRQAHSSLFPNQSEQNFHLQRGCVFSGLDPKLCCSRGLRTAYVAHNKFCSTI